MGINSPFYMRWLWANDFTNNSICLWASSFGFLFYWVLGWRSNALVLIWHVFIYSFMMSQVHLSKKLFSCYQFTSKRILRRTLRNSLWFKKIGCFMKGKAKEGWSFWNTILNQDHIRIWIQWIISQLSLKCTADFSGLVGAQFFGGTKG